MLDLLRARIKQGYRTIRFPLGAPPPMPDRFRGWPLIETDKCPRDCERCIKICPTGAITASPRPRVDLGKCLFCNACSQICPRKGIRYSNDYRLAVRHREDLAADPAEGLRLAYPLQQPLKRIFRKSLKLRQVSAGGCNACEADTNVLSTIGWDLGRFGIQIVASPRHADGLLITGPVTANMKTALLKTYEAVPDPKIVIAVGACAISGGLFRGNEEVCDGAGTVVPVDLFVPGCPPHPLTILDGLLRLTGRIR